MDTVLTLASLPAILALVNLGKRFGLAGPWAALVAVLLGTGLNVAEVTWAGNALYEAAAQGLIMGLGAAGLYDVATTLTGAKPTDPPAGDFVEPDLEDEPEEYIPERVEA